jgi:ubiquinone biosynthesis protein Coq4
LLWHGQELSDLRVISVTIGQIRYPAFILIDLLSSLLVFTTDVKREGVEVPLKYNFDLISQGIAIAGQAKQLFPIKFEEALEHPLDEWRAELNIKPVTAGLWSCYTRPNILAAIEA